MANEQQLELLLLRGTVAWNQWRQEYPAIHPDLRGADLAAAKLYKANLIRADLAGATLLEADLAAADLRGANFRAADLRGANLRAADLTRADLAAANLHAADLTRADLTEANLVRADLSGAKLHAANLHAAVVGWTSFEDVDLSTVKDLDTIHHLGPSPLSLDTLYRSHGNIPDRFLRGAGVPETFIDYMHALVGTASAYASCFISYSSTDQAFAERLYADLQRNHVRCRLAPDDLKSGAHIGVGMDQAIRLHDKLLLVLSKTSTTSAWVEQEVETALARERREKRRVLIPVRLDDAS